MSRAIPLALLLLAGLAAWGAQGLENPNPTTTPASAPTDRDGDGSPAGTDCADGDAAAAPGKDELCDGKDNDCDGKIDEPDATDAKTFYADKDVDTYGDSEATTKACRQPKGYVARAGDCNDSKSSVSPKAIELCDGADNDCDGSTDEDDASNAKTFYADGDGDGFGSKGSPKRACQAPTGFVADARDCADGDGGANPGATETCNGKDDDCDGKTDEADASDASTWYPDKDGDSFGNKSLPLRACNPPTSYVADNTDCNDTAASANPKATEVCDGRDNDCDGASDENDASDVKTWYADKDLDGFGDAGASTKACTAPKGHVWSSTDCNDGKGGISPKAIELCDGVDNDCDGSTDEDDASNAKTWYADGDSDGFGNKSSLKRACEAPAGFVADARDCADGDGGANPGATETCDGKDNDCDGKTDEPDASDASTWYPDKDGDSFGLKSLPLRACKQPAAYVADNTDCNDAASSANPKATEVCDGRDNDCDGSSDENDASDAKTWYADKDLDGFGDAGASATACTAPRGHVSNSTDCNDAKGSISPRGIELCDGVDNDCDGSTDEPDATNAKTFYADKDSDGFGDRGSNQRACEAPAGFVADARDCSDGDGGANPGATETCDGKDNDCDGKTDEPDASDASTWYPDKDGDSFGLKSLPLRACKQPAAYVADNTDCNDAASSANPRATEVCDGRDNDCDGSTDEPDASDAKTFYADADLDGFGDAGTSTKACSAPKGHVSNSTDCNDGKSGISPRATELCDGVDNDCDGSTDEPDAANAKTFYADKDSDSFGDRGSAQRACEAPAGFVADARDCADGDRAVNPSSAEVCDGKDNDCDSKADESDASDASTWYLDADRDNFGDARASVRACKQPSGYVSDSTDCNATTNTAYPGATERCDGRDNDCDGTTDEDDAVDAKTWYADLDKDRFGDTGNSTKSCRMPVGYLTDSRDCDDSSALAKPGGREVCDGRDNDCNGTIDDDSAPDAKTWYADTDGDQYGDRNGMRRACTAPRGYVAEATDCSDSDAKIYPGAPELCDGKDSNCDASDEVNRVAFLPASGGVVDVSAKFLGAEGKPARYNFEEPGTLRFCDGTYYTNIIVTASKASIESMNGRDATTLNGAGVDAVVRSSTDLTLRGVTLTGGLIGDSGGGLTVLAGTATVDACRIAENQAGNFGGGIFVTDGTLVVRNSALSGNKAIGGGAIYGFQSKITVDKGSVEANNATDGAGIYARFSQVALNGTLLVNNNASSQGGALEIYGKDASVSCGGGATLQGNTATRGAAAHLGELASVRSAGCSWGGGASHEIYLENAGAFQYGAAADFTCDQAKGCR